MIVEIEPVYEWVEQAVCPNPAIVWPNPWNARVCMRLLSGFVDMNGVVLQSFIDTENSCDPDSLDAVALLLTNYSGMSGCPQMHLALLVFLW